MEVARTVLMGGKSGKIYLSNLGQRVRKKSKLKLISGGVTKVNKFFFLDPKPGDLAMSKLKKW